MMGAILIASEDYGRRLELGSALIALGYRIIEAENGLRTLDILRRRRNIDLVFIETSMTDIGGADLIASIRSAGISIPLVVLVEEEQDDLQKVLHSGANEYLVYPISHLRLSTTLSNVTLANTYQREIQYMRRNAEKNISFDDISTKSEAMRKTVDAIRSISKATQNVLIEGEVGTGRETIARLIHMNSQYKDGSFMLYRCRSFWGVDKKNDSWFEDFDKMLARVKGGTLCLMDVERLDWDQQKYLLDCLKKRALQAKTAGRPDFRMITIALPRLSDFVDAEGFLPELYNVLAPEIIRVPPLRERREDLHHLIQYFVDRLIVETGHSYVHGISGSALAFLMQHDWPGNVSELENMLFRAVQLTKGPLLTLQDFPALLSGDYKDSAHEENSPIVQNTRAVVNSYYGEDGHIKPLSQIELEVIEEALKRYKGRMSEVARRLKIGRSTLYRKLGVE